MGGHSLLLFTAIGVVSFVLSFYGSAVGLILGHLRLPLLLIAPPTILGGYLGSRFTGRFNKGALQRLVGATIALTGLGMTTEGLWKTLLS